ncbi:hypothetical protein FHX75_12277 [Micromonospora palomenae]|uniref:Uncharacterized protein n=2 Tax=Micromonospora palomenae TaxID=1461247 RepID=A0A561WD24_9ACTN|nr:hypothetical protein FHX75_12277 [Micromonospora palomenae]
MVLAALVACAALSACGGQDGDDRTGTPSPSEGSPVTSTPSSGDPSGVPPTAPPSTALPPTARPPTKRPPVGPSVPPGPGATTISGTVEAGVEPNCLMVEGYQLIGGPRDVLTVGARVTVTGQPKPDMMTTCQQGTPFVVESARRS